MEERVIEVDERDRVLGYPLRSELTTTQRYRVVTIWIEDGQGNALIARRAPTKSIHPNLWGPAAAGTVNKDESYELCATRELKEELGIEADSLEYVGKRLVDGADGSKRVSAKFRLILPVRIEELKLQVSEVAEVQWAPKRELFQDVTEHPENYVPSAQDWEAFFGQ